MSVDSSTSVVALDQDKSWTELQLLFDPTLNNRSLANILEQLNESGVKSAIIEHDYLDRDYSEEFKAFYATLFPRYRRHTKRLHFFRQDISAQVSSLGALETANFLTTHSKDGDYVGFIVIRPVRDAPLGRVVLNVLQPPPDIHTAIEVRGDYEVHLLGATLVVRGAPFTQQDTRITACAQASIWMVGRHFYAKHKGPWFSTVRIADAASHPTDAMLSSSLPAGGGGLGITNMVRALRAMDRQPYSFSAEIDEKTKLPSWPAYLEPESIIARYVESGIPVILGLNPWETGQRDGHAVVVVGTTFQARPNLTFESDRPNISQYIPFFLVNDDQRGINLRMPVVKGTLDGETPYTVRDHVQFILIPLPEKVFVSGETVERRSWDILAQFYSSEWPGLRQDHAPDFGPALALADGAAIAFQQKQIVSRTYLTFGWKYKQRLIEGDISKTIKSLVALHQFPRMVWVTEFGIASDVNQLEPAKRRIFAHCVHDATIATDGSPPLVFHMPGLLWLWSQCDPSFYSTAEVSLYPISDDAHYTPRWRHP